MDLLKHLVKPKGINYYDTPNQTRDRSRSLDLYIGNKISDTDNLPASKQLYKILWCKLKKKK